MNASATAGVDRATPGYQASLARFLPSPMLCLGILIVGILLFLVVMPMTQLVLTSFRDTQDGSWTLSNYLAAYSSTRHIRALGNSLLLGAWVTAVSAIFAVPLAWAVSRTDMPFKGFVRAMVLGAFITPPYLGAIGWILLAGPNAGFLNKAWMFLTGAESGFLNVYSFTGLVMLIAFYSFPYIFFFTSSALDNVSSEMEDAAHIMGAGTTRTTLFITLPLVFPAILGGAVITFLESITLFGTPALIALPARINIVTTQLWEFFEYPIRVEVAAAYSLPLLMIVAAVFFLQRLALGRRGYLTVTGKGGQRRMIELGAFRWLAFGYAFFVVSLAVLLPYGMLVQAAFSRAWARGLSVSNFTLDNFHYILFQHFSAKQSIINSFLFGGAAAVAAVFLGLCAAYIVVRRLMPMANVLAFLCTAPFVVPGIVLAIAFYAAYAPPPFSLYGTATILILAFTTRFLPIAYANAAAGVRSLNPEMEEAVRVLGGTRLTAVREVVAPLMKKTLAGGIILVLIPAIRELSAAIFLVGPTTRVMSVLVLDLSEEGNFESLAALGCVMMVSTLVIVGIGFRLLGRDFMLRR